MNRVTRVFTVLVLSQIAISASASVITFNISYQDPANWSPTARTALQTAANNWGNLLEASFAGETIEIVADFGATTGLAGTHVSTWAAINARVASPIAISSHFLGSDVSAGNPEMHISFNASNDWYFGVDGLGPVNQFDFVSVAMHEIAHGLGWLSNIEIDGSGNDALGGRYSIYDTLVWSLTHSNWLIDLDPMLISNELTGGELFWGGIAGVAANGGTRPELDSPPVFRAGTSVSHLDRLAFSGFLMDPTRNPGEVVHSVSAVERGILRDLFWTFTSDNVTPVPEPSTSIIFAGLSLAIPMINRRVRCQKSRISSDR